LFDGGEDTALRLFQIVADAITLGEASAINQHCRQTMHRGGAGLAGFLDRAETLFGIQRESSEAVRFRPA
jgi:hypothetical protein